MLNLPECWNGFHVGKLTLHIKLLGFCLPHLPRYLQCTDPAVPYVVLHLAMTGQWQHVLLWLESPDTLKQFSCLPICKCEIICTSHFLLHDISILNFQSIKVEKKMRKTLFPLNFFYLQFMLMRNLIIISENLNWYFLIEAIY